MDRETALETIFDHRTYNGIEELEARLDSDNPVDGHDDPLADAIATVGVSRVRQLLGLDGELWYTVWTARTADVDDQVEVIRDRLDSLWTAGTIADYDVKSIPKRLDPDAARADQVQMYQELQACAARKDLTLDPFFRRDENGIILPDVFLVVRSVSHRLYSIPTEDRDTSGLNLVFPCSDGRHHYSIIDYLSAVKAGEEWRDSEHVTALSQRDFGAHGAIKARIAQRPGEIIGTDWQFFGDERGTKNPGAEDAGRIDLVFSHRIDRRFLLVEVKPSRQEVDSAFGQLGRYKYQFIDDVGDPELTADDVELAIAAPEFTPSHRRFADDVGIKLLEVDL
jgi:hypothetical protein